MSPLTLRCKTDDVILVKIQRFIPTKRWRVLRMISKVSDFPRFMPNVKKAEVIERTENGVLSEWQVDMDGLPIHWKQKDVFDFSNFTICFESLVGDLEEFKGQWKLEKRDQGTQVTLEVSARLGIPIIERVVADILQEKLTKNFQLILDGMENRFITERYNDMGLRGANKPTGFVVMGHPYNFNHLIRYFKFFKPDLTSVTKDFVLKLFELTPSYHSYDIPNFRSKTGKTTQGYFVLCPIIPDMLTVSPERVLQKVAEGCRIGERLGAGIVALGGFTSIVGERYHDELRKMVKIPLTTGNTFTAAMALDGVKKAAELMGIEMGKATVTVIGGTGDIGGACAHSLAKDVKEIILTGRNKDNLNKAKEAMKRISKAKISVSTDNNESAKKADIVIAAASSSQSLVDLKCFKPGSIICDVAYPKNTSYMTAYRNDIFAFAGGMCEAPSSFDLGFDIGLPSKNVLYGCFAEAMILSLEERYENYSHGKGRITQENMQEIRSMGAKHGFRVAPFYWGDRLMREEDIMAIRKNVRGV